MKFITSTNLNNWADTKECQQLLPELVRKLIEASVSNLVRLSFPSGDAVALPGWDGIVSCEECIDLVPEGISLWECGAMGNVKNKLDSDFEKRNKDPRGYDKSSATFVLVTPRIWNGAEKWMKNHQDGWKKIVVYTAIELERWIEQNPSVGMWLAEKLRILPAGGCVLPESYWEKWAQGENISLPYQIVLPGREIVSKKIIEACTTPSLLVLQALTHNECIAFAIASVLTCELSHSLKSRLVVVTEKNALEDLVSHYDNLIILTTLTETLQYTIKRGHSVIVASTPADQIKGAVSLPIIEKQGFVKALVDVGISEIESSELAKKAMRDVNILRRFLKISFEKPKWAELSVLCKLLPAILAGKWNGNLKGDRELLEILSGKSYEDFEIDLQPLLKEVDSPIIHRGSIWRIRSPYEVMTYAKSILTDSMMEKYRRICLFLIQDDDPDAVKKMKSEIFIHQDYKRKYSSVIKTGVFQNLILLSLENDQYAPKFWVEEILKEMLDNWTLTRFLSNRSNLETLAEASPQAFLHLMESMPDDVTAEIFTPRKQTFWPDNIYYAELLFSLEMLAWDDECLNCVTKLLLRYSKYKNESNYSNKPINSLLSIYRLFHPQTNATFASRMSLLKALSTEYKEIIFKLCVSICESLGTGWFNDNTHYKWRMFGTSEQNSSGVVKMDDIDVVVQLMLQCCEPTAENLSTIFELSFNHNVGKNEAFVVDFIRNHLVDFEDRQIVADTLRKEINHYMAYPNSCRSLSSADLDMYTSLLKDIEPKDAINKNLWLFESSYIQLPHKRTEDLDYEQEHRELLNVRCKVVKEIIDMQGNEGIWDLVNAAKCLESVAECVVNVLGRGLYETVCRKYKSKQVCENFAQAYFRTLFCKETDVYPKIARQTVEKDADMAVVLYAPYYNRNLASVAENFGEKIKEQYWKFVDVRFLEIENSADVVRELVNVGRYSDAIDVIWHNIKTIEMSDVEIARIVLGRIMGCEEPLARLDMYNLKKILNKLEKSDDSEIISILVQVEFYLYEHLEHCKDMAKSRLIKELMSNPNLMIELIENTYKADDGTCDVVEENSLENRKIIARLAWRIFHYGCSLTPGVNDEGKFDEVALLNYIDQLYALSRQKKRTKATDFIVGFMLGDGFCSGKYPIDVLGKIVEKLKNDIVDEHIRVRIYNSRGVVTRSCNEGGEQERKLINKYKEIKKQTQFLYPRMTKIFNELIDGYSHEASREDENAYMMDLEF